jgi:integrase
MTIKFYLDKPSATTETAIYLFLRFGKSTLKFNTGKKIHPKYWNKDNVENPFRKFTGSPEMNQWLSNLKSNVNKAFYSVDDWTLEDLKSTVLAHIEKRNPKVSQQPFDDALTEFMSSRESSNELALNTIKKYHTLAIHLRSFAVTTKTTLRFENINKRFYDEFSAYLRNNLGHTTNTVNKYIKTFKTFINWAIDHEHTKSEIATTKYKLSDNPTEVVYLTYEELMSIYNLELPEGSSLDKVRDVFCFGCFTGQRFSDIANLKHEDIKRDVWVLHQVKVKDTIQNEVPLSGKALFILSKYKNAPKPLPVISNQKTNEFLKTLAEKAGICDIVKIVRYRGNEPMVVREPKYKLIGTHTARRTFITLSLEMNMRPETVMAISGHTDFKSMKRYIAVTNNMKAGEMKLAWNNLDQALLAKQS